MSAGMAVRIGMGITLGGAAIAALAFGVGFAGESGEGEAVPGSTPGEPAEGTRIAIPKAWYGEAQRIVLRLDDDHGAAAPVAEILPTGRIVLRRPPPVPSGPVSAPWEMAGVRLPSDVGELAREARSALLALFAAWSGGRGLTVDRLTAEGFALDPDELAHLMRWQR